MPLNMILAATTNWLLKPFAILLSWIFNGIFALISQITTHQALAITIVLFTFIVRAAMMPMMIKQQRSTRKMARLQPKIDKIQAKYKNKKDPESSQRMNAEIQQLYSDNKANPFSGCLPLLIQMPIIFALFEVLRNVPFYVNDIGSLFKTMTETVQGVSGYADVLTNNFGSVISKFDASSATSVMDLLSHLTRSQWQVLMDTLGLTSNTGFMEAYKLQEAYNTLGAGALTFNLSENPDWKSWGIIFPILSGATTFLQSWLTQHANEKRQRMASPDGTITQQQKSMKMMTYLFPLMTVWFTITMPIGLGLYWIVGNIFAILSQWISDSVIDKEEYREALKHRDELIAKRKEREERRSSIDKATGGRIGTLQTNNNKSSMAGNKKAAYKQQDEDRRKALGLSQEKVIDIEPQTEEKSQPDETKKQEENT